MHSIKFPFLSLVGILVCFTSCHQQESQQVEELPSSLPAYELIGKPAVPPGVSLAISASPLPDAEGLLQLKVLLKNSRAEPLFINSAGATLLSQEGWRTSPEQAASKPALLPPGAADTILLQYKPINNMQLYRHTGARGALTKEYRLPLFFVEDAQGNALLHDTLGLRMSDRLYQQYLHTTGEAEPIKLYKLKQDKKQEEQLTERLQKLVRDGDHSGEVRIMEEEVFMGGLNIRVGIYEKNDTLAMNLRMVNHSPFALSLNPSRLGLRTSRKELVTYERTNAQPVLLKKGQRFTIVEKYKKHEDPDSLWLIVDGITLKDKNTSLLEGRLLLTRWEP